MYLSATAVKVLAARLEPCGWSRSPQSSLRNDILTLIKYIAYRLKHCNKATAKQFHVFHWFRHSNSMNRKMIKSITELEKSVRLSSVWCKSHTYNIYTHIVYLFENIVSEVWSPSPVFLIIVEPAYWVFLDSKLNWKEHLNYLITKCEKKLIF